MQPKILLLEDDHIQRDAVMAVLHSNFEVEIVVANSESEFHRDFELYEASPPQVAILDVMTRWASPVRGGMPPRPSGIPNDPQGAGLRCGRMLRNAPRTASAKIIYYSVLSKDDFVRDSDPGDAICLVKEPDFQELLDAVRSFLPEAVLS